MKKLSKLFEFVSTDEFASLSSVIRTKQLVLNLDYLGYTVLREIEGSGFCWTAFPQVVNGIPRLEVYLS